MHPNQQSYNYCEINRLEPRIPLSQINHTLDLMVEVMLSCRNTKQIYYIVRSTYSTDVNDLLRQNLLLDAVFSVSFTSIY